MKLSYEIINYIFVLTKSCTLGFYLIFNAVHTHLGLDISQILLYCMEIKAMELAM